MAETPPRRKSLGFRLVRAVLLGIGGFYLMAGILAMAFGDAFIFYPERHPSGPWTARESASVLVEEVEFPAADGTKLVAWHARPASPRATILFFHGNAGNISHRLFVLESLAKIGAATFGVDYRGYGKSEGAPSEQGLYADAEGAYRHLTEKSGVTPDRLILFGKSLGSGPAVELASKVPCAGLILQSPFTSVPDVASSVIPLFPAGIFLRTRFDNASRIGKVRVPKLFILTEDDEVIPASLTRRLYEAAPEPRELVAFRGAGHNELIDAHRGEWRRAIAAFLDRCCGE